MSNIPSTSLVINPDGLETIGGRIPDVIYLMAPAMKGGEKLDDYGLPIRDQNGNTVFTHKIFSTRSTFEREFGTARQGSEAAIYAKWIFDKGNYAVRCRRVVGPGLAYASAKLFNDMQTEIINVTSLSQSRDANNITVDVDASTNREAYLVRPNASYDPMTGLLQTEETYTSSDRLFFDAIRTSDSLPFRIEFYGNGNNQNFSLFTWSPVNSSAPFIITDGQTTFEYAGDNLPVESLNPDQYSYDSGAKELRFGSAPAPGSYNLMINTLCPFGNARITVPSNGVSKTYSLNFVSSEVQFNHLYVNGIGSQYDQRFLRLVRLYTVSQYISMRGVVVSLSPGTNINTAKMRLIAGTGTNMKTEVYDNLQNLSDIVNRVNSTSALIQADALTSNLDALPSYCSDLPFVPIGVMITIRNGMEEEKFDDLRSAEHISEVVNNGTNGSDLVNMQVIGLNAHELPSLISDVKLSGGNSGSNPAVVDYLDALAEAEAILDITIVIAPGVDDEAFHGLMKDHCELSARRGNYRLAFVGGRLGETMERKKARTRAFNSERLAYIGDGLHLVDPQDGRRKLYAPSVVVAPFAAQVVSLPFYVPQTYKYITNAYGVEHEYDDAQHNDLHWARLITFRINNGVQIVDAITTSTKSAYEDIHMMRIYDVVSRGVNKAMEKAIGKTNMPPTWAFVLGLIQKFLETLRNIGAIMDFRLLNEVRPQDLVDRRFKFRISLIPTFPIKYVESEIDLIPPTYVPIQ